VSNPRVGRIKRLFLFFQGLHLLGVAGSIPPSRAGPRLDRASSSGTPNSLASDRALTQWPSR
jgi:hypothetical protein